MTGGRGRPYPEGVAHDEEFRRVAEDLRALGRSLARDFWQATDQARSSGGPPGQVLRHGLRHVAGEARKGLRRSSLLDGHGPRRRYGSPYGWGPPRGYRTGADRPAPPGWGDPSTRGTWQQRPGPPPTWRRAPQPTRAGHPTALPVRRRWDGTALLAALILLFGTAWLLGALGVLHLPTEGVAAVGLMVLGSTVIVTARTDWSLSRHAWPVWAGAVVLVVLVITSAAGAVGGALDHVSFGRMDRVATSGGTVYGGIGTLDVDATRLRPGATVTIESAAGRTFVTTPPGVPIDLHARLLAGQVCVGNQPQGSGLGTDVSGRFGTGTAAPLQLRVDQLAGQVVIDGSGCSRR